jgi:hypothetical protein
MLVVVESHAHAFCVSDGAPTAGSSSIPVLARHQQNNDAYTTFVLTVP